MGICKSQMIYVVPDAEPYNRYCYVAVLCILYFTPTLLNRSKNFPDYIFLIYSLDELLWFCSTITDILQHLFCPTIYIKYFKNSNITIIMLNTPC